MKKGGFIKLFRQILDWEWYKDANTMRVFLHLLLKANYEDSQYRGEPVPRGSAVFGRIELSAVLGLTEQQIRTALQHLMSTNEIAIKTTNKFSVASITNYELYQGIDSGSNQQSSQHDNHDLTNDQPHKRSKEEKKERKTPPVVPHISNSKNAIWKERTPEQVREWVLEQNGGKEFSDMYEFLIKSEAEHIYHLEQLMGYKEFNRFVKYCNYCSVQWKDVIMAMTNNPDRFVNSRNQPLKKNMYLTARDWAAVRAKQKI